MLEKREPEVLRFGTTGLEILQIYLPWNNKHDIHERNQCSLNQGSRIQLVSLTCSPPRPLPSTPPDSRSRTAAPPWPRISPRPRFHRTPRVLSHTAESEHGEYSLKLKRWFPNHTWSVLHFSFVSWIHFWTYSVLHSVLDTGVHCLNTRIFLIKT